MRESTVKKPFWMFLFCAFMQEITFLFIYSVSWAVIDHFYVLGGKFDWGLTVLLAIYAFFIATIIQWTLFYLLKARYMYPIIGVSMLILASLIYTPFYPYRSLFLLACLLAAMLLASFLFGRLVNFRKNPLTGTPNSTPSDLLDDDWDRA